MASKIILIVALLLSSTIAQARPPPIDIEVMNIDGTIRTPEERVRDPRTPGRIPIGDSRQERPEAKRPELRPEDPAAKAQREALLGLQKTIGDLSNIGLDVVQYDLGPANGKIVWFFYEVATRMLVDGGLAQPHPMEDPRTFTRDAYSIDRIVELRNALSAEADEAWKSRPPEKMRDAATRSFSIIETNLINAAIHVSPEAGAAAVFLLRLGRISDPMLPSPSPAVEAFISARPIASANACWVSESSMYYRVPRSIPGQRCLGYWPNGQPTRKDGVTVYRPLGNQCSIAPGKSCIVPNPDVAGAPCYCMGPGFTEYGRLVAKRPVGLRP